MFLSSLTLYITYSNFALISVMRCLLQFYGTRMGAFLTRCLGSSVVLLSDLIWHPIYVFYTYKTIYASSQKPSRKAKICRCHFLPSSIEAGSSNVWQCSQIILPTRTTIQWPFVPALEPVRRKSGAQGELCLRALFTHTQCEAQFKKSARVVRKRP